MISGDVHFFIYHKTYLDKEKICRFSLNTSFVKNNQIEFSKAKISPDSVSVSKKFHDDFKITLYFSNYCKVGCDPERSVEELCSRCKTKMESTLEEWDVINKIKSDHSPYPHKEFGEKVLFFGPSDYDDVT